jgi:glycosyltransferase involved in cell wall biosynthesis
MSTPPDGLRNGGLAAFGPVATAWLGLYDDRVDAVIADGTGVAHGIQEVVQRKRAGKSFFVVPVVEDRATVVARAFAAEILKTESDFHRRYELLDHLGLGTLSYAGRSQNSYEVDDWAAKISLRDFMRLGSSLLVRSWAEYQRVVTVVGEAPLHSTRALQSARAFPAWNGRVDGEHFVIWAPECKPRDLAITAFALENLHRKTYVVCQNPELGLELGLRATFIGLEDAVPILENAIAIVVSDISSPEAAVALAKGGVPLAVASTSGAHEYVDGVAVFVPHSIHSTRGAALVALASGPPRLRSDLPFDVDYEGELEKTAPPRTLDPPLVSIVVSTKNRREVLPRSLDSISAQTYPNIEILVVNDGGVPIGDIVERYPNATLVEYDESKGLVARLREGASMVSGKYCVAHSDDDFFFPDHFARCIYALERTGAVASRPIVLFTFNAPGADGRYHVVGHTVHHYYAYDPTELLWANNMGVVVQTRQSIFDHGLWSGEAGQVMDWDCFLRLAKVSDLPCIPAVTVNFDQRTDGSNMNDGGVGQWQTDVTKLYRNYSADYSTYVEQRRAEVLARARFNDMKRIQPMHAATPLDPPAPGDYHLFTK